MFKTLARWKQNRKSSEVTAHRNRQGRTAMEDATARDGYANAEESNRLLWENVIQPMYKLGEAMPNNVEEISVANFTLVERCPRCNKPVCKGDPIGRYGVIDTWWHLECYEHDKSMEARKLIKSDPGKPAQEDFDKVIAYNNEQMRLSGVDVDAILKEKVVRTTNTQTDETGMVDHPIHYNAHPSGVECIEIVRHMGFNLGSAVKYIWRADIKHDDALEDLKKALFYINDEIALREGKFNATDQ